MNILILSKYYKPELTGIAPFVTEISQFLASRGHQVTVITSFPHFPEWRVQQEYRGRFYSVETDENMRLIRCWTYVPRIPRAVRRIISDTIFSIQCLVCVGFLFHRYDVVYVVSPPPTLAFAGFLLRFLFKSKVVVEVRDLVAEALTATQLIKSEVVNAFVDRLENFVLRRADAVSVLSSGFRENIARKGIPNERISLIPNWGHLNFSAVSTRHNVFRSTHGISDHMFIVMFSGAFGKKDNLRAILDAARDLQTDSDILITLIGDGIQKEELVRAAQEMHLSNVRFLPLQPNEMFPFQLAAADVLIASYYKAVIDFCMPSKILTYMSSGRPLIVAANDRSDTARVVAESKGGALLIEPERPDKIRDSILSLYRSKELRERIGETGRKFVQEKFSRDAILPRYEELLTSPQNGSAHKGAVS